MNTPAVQSMSILDRAEQTPLFDPVNLLAFRYLATASPIVMQAASDKLRRWPTEPFAIGAEKPKEMAEMRQRKRIADSREFVSVYAAPSKERVISDSVDTEPGKGIAAVDYAESGGASVSNAAYSSAARKARIRTRWQPFPSMKTDSLSPHSAPSGRWPWSWAPGFICARSAPPPP